eukprot:TRINITY_DN11176_c0_g1_i1.p1 TRINITY_DN11176_c0_g1~~TRINITY_DN11176_c0_g1_i1.p1  ORF type:complete len:519 (-),score=113.41 TRINITY_DN11176_c0_g1_i1:116-1672(-)
MQSPLPACLELPVQHASHVIDHAESLAYALSVCKKLPTNARAHFQCGLVLLDQAKYLRAREQFERALSCVGAKGSHHNSAKLQASIQYHLAQAMWLQLCSTLAVGDMVSSLQAQDVLMKLKQALELDPQTLQVAHFHAVVLFRSGDFPAAITALQALIDAHPNFVDAFIVLSLAQRTVGNLVEAFKACETALDLSNRTNPDVLNNYGVLCMDVKQYVPAVESFQAAVTLDPTRPQLWCNLAVAYTGRSEHEFARRAMEKARHAAVLCGVTTIASPFTLPEDRSATDAIAHAMSFNEAVRLVQCGETDAAQTVLAEQSQSLLHVLGATAACERKKLAIGTDPDARERSVRFYTRAINIDANNSSLWTQFALVYLGEGEYAVAVDYLKHALSLNPDNFVAWANLGIAYQLNHDPLQAEKAYQTALSMNEYSHQVLNNLGNLYRQQGDLQRAEEAYMQCLTVHPTSADVHNNLALLCIRKHDYHKALEYFNRALELNPSLQCAMSNRFKVEAMLAAHLNAP